MIGKVLKEESQHSIFKFLSYETFIHSNLFLVNNASTRFIKAHKLYVSDEQTVFLTIL